MLVAAQRQAFAADHRFDRQAGFGYWTLELTTAGAMARRSGSMRRFARQPNETLLLTPPETPYGLRGQAPGDEIWLIFDPPPRLEAHLQWAPGSFDVPELAVPPTATGRQLLRAFEEACDWFSGRQPLAKELADNALERLLLLAVQVAVDQAPSDDRVRRSQARIAADYATPLTVAALARAVHLSESHFAHLFRQEVGVSPIEYLERVRLEQAQLLLLRSDLQVQEVAARVGFACPYYFSTRFRRRLGCAPSAWRRRPVLVPA